MPLLGDKPFERKKLNPKLKPSQEVFFCPLTCEAFTSFDEYFERTIQLSSMQWTCQVTGKTGLTFQEAMDSEETATTQINEMSRGLRKALLYLAYHTQTAIFKDICHFLWTYATGRYFVGEDVEVVLDLKKNMRTFARIIRVIPPNGSELAIIKEKGDISYGIDPTVFRYEITPVEKRHVNYRCIVKASQVNRYHNNLTKERIKLLLKANSILTKRNQIIEIKEESAAEYSLMETAWDPDIYAGPFPKIDPEDPSLPSNSNKRFSTKPDSSDKKTDGRKKKIVPPTGSQKKSSKKLSEEDKKRETEAEKRRKIEEKKQRIQEMKKEREEEEKRMKEWSKPRDDLECDDLKPIPVGIPIDCPIENAMMGDALMILEFYSNFSEFFELEEIFPHGFTFDLLIKTLTEQSIKSCPISDLIKITLATIFVLQEDAEKLDNEQRKEEETLEQQHQKFYEKLDNHNDDDDDRKCGQNLVDAIKQANMHEIDLKRMVGTKLSVLKMNAFTITEALRQHLLVSGAYRVRSLYRGWYNSREDPALTFTMEHPLLMEKLMFNSIYDLDAKERILIFQVLIHQLMSFQSFREILDSSIDKIVELKKEIRSSQAEFAKWDRDSQEAIKARKGEALLASGDTYEEPQDLKDMKETFSTEKDKRLAKLNSRHAALKAKIRAIEGMYSVKPLGRDRSYRRYYLFNALPGLFVERDEIYPGLCVDHPYGAKVPSDSPPNNKENEQNIAAIDHIFPRTMDLECTGDEKTCAVHGAAKDTNQKWTFYPMPQDVDDLIESLNERGFREKELKKVLTKNIDAIKESIEKCNIGSLNPILASDEVRKSTRLVFYRPGSIVSADDKMTPSEALKVSFKETLGKFDEQLFWSGFSFQSEATSMTHDEWKIQLDKVDLNRASANREMGQLMVVLAESVTPKQLTAPLGQAAPENQSVPWTGLNNLLKNWAAKVRTAKSMSRLFFLLDILDSSINWSERVTRRKKNAQNMVICDGCNRLKSPETPPEGPFFCSDCKAKGKGPSKKTTKSKGQDIVDLGDDESIPDDDCVNIRKPPSETLTEDSQEESTLVSEGESRSATSPEDMNVCAHCGSPDDEPEITCRRCSRQYHVTCHRTKVGSLRNFICDKCTKVDTRHSKRRQTRKRYNESSDAETSEDSNSEDGLRTKRRRVIRMPIKFND